MAFNREQAQRYARDVSITKEHSIDTATLLRGFSLLALPDTPRPDKEDIRLEVTYEKPQIPRAAARHLYSILHAPAPPWTSFEGLKDHDIRQPAREQDLEPLQALDADIVDQVMARKDLIVIPGTQYTEGPLNLPCTISDPAADHTEDVMNEKSVPDHSSQLSTHNTTETRLKGLSTPVGICVQIPSSGLNLSPLNLAVSDTQSGLPSIKKDMPSGTRDNPFVLDSLEDTFSRISMTPEAELHRQVDHTMLSSASSKRKLGSVLDPLISEDHVPKRRGLTQEYAPLETSFSTIAFGLMTKQAVRFERPKQSTTNQEVSSSTPAYEKNHQDQPNILTLSQNTDPSGRLLENIQLVVASHGHIARRISANLCRTLPRFSVVERDFAASWISPKGILADADVIISPQTGIVLADIEEVQQQPLPGTRDLSRFQRRMTMLASKYETLYVLVRSVDTVKPDTLSEILAFACRLGLNSNTIIYTETFPCNSGIEAILARVLELVSKSRIQFSKMRLEDSEFDWERCLRKDPGLNAYAAQVIVQKLLALDKDETKDMPTMLKQLLDDGALNDLLGAKSVRILERKAGAAQSWNLQ